MYEGAATVNSNPATVTVNSADKAPEIIEGAGQEVVIGNDALFVSDADYSLFEKVLVDGETLMPNTDYTSESGFTRVKLLGRFTSTLSLGSHTLSIVSSTGAAATTFTVISPLKIITHPSDQFVAEGQKATFSLSVAGGVPPYSYQWYINRNDGWGWKKIDGATGTSYTTSVTKLSNNGFKYYCTVSDSIDQTVDSNSATLFVSKYTVPPKTGDSSAPLLWLGLALVGLGGLAALLLGKMKAF